MSLRTWFKNLTSSCGLNSLKDRHRSPLRNRDFSHRLLTFEAMEDRSLLSALTVLNNLDSGAGSLRADIAAAHSGDTIAFAPSLAGQTITLTSGELLINKNLTISGPGAGDLTISGNNHSRVFEVGTGTQATVSGLTISNGFDAQGAGILNNGTLTLTDSILSGNSANKVVKKSTLPNAGGAIENRGTLTIAYCQLTGNSASLGGGIDNHGSATVNSSTLMGNSVTASGGAIVNQGTLSVNNSTLSNNTATSDGGAIDSYGTANVTVAVTGSYLSGNTAVNGSGGAISNHGNLLTVSANSTLSGNHAGNDGGGIATANDPNAKIVVSDSTLSGNSAWAGGGIYTWNVYGTTAITNCTLSDNTARNAGGAIFVGSATMTVSGSTLSGNSANTYGGAIDVFVGALKIDSSGLTNNVALVAGGGIYNSSAGPYGTPTVTVENSSSVNGNTAPAGEGADIYNLGVVYLDSTSSIGIVDGIVVTRI